MARKPKYKDVPRYSINRLAQLEAEKKYKEMLLTMNKGIITKLQTSKKNETNKG